MVIAAQPITMQLYGILAADWLVGGGMMGEMIEGSAITLTSRTIDYYND